MRDRAGNVAWEGSTNRALTPPAGGTLAVNDALDVKGQVGQ